MADADLRGRGRARAVDGLPVDQGRLLVEAARVDGGGRWIACQRCTGLGKLLLDDPGPPELQWEPCPDCDGRGSVRMPWGGPNGVWMLLGHAGVMAARDHLQLHNWPDDPAHHFDAHGVDDGHSSFTRWLDKLDTCWPHHVLLVASCGVIRLTRLRAEAICSRHADTEDPACRFCKVKRMARAFGAYAMTATANDLWAWRNTVPSVVSDGLLRAAPTGWSNPPFSHDAARGELVRYARDTHPTHVRVVVRDMLVEWALYEPPEAATV